MTETFAVLTGASRGIGAALARALARPGTQLVTLARRQDAELDAYAAQQGVQVLQWQVDLSDPAAAQDCAQRLARAVPRDAGRYLLINNAGSVEPVVAVDRLAEPAAIQAAFSLNVTAVMVLTAHFLAATRPLAGDRRVLNISSGAGRNPTAGWGVYCATKAALDMYTRVAAQEAEQEQAGAGASRARFVSLAPGVVDTDMQAVIRGSDPAHFPALQRFQDMHATGKLATPADVAARIVKYLDRNDFGSTVVDDIRNYD
jgi:sepiapterin reductase